MQGCRKSETLYCCGLGTGGAKLKHVQISEELFMNLVKYHLLGVEEVVPEVKQGLESKLEAMDRRELYTEYKMGKTEEDREIARKEYLKKRGMKEYFRW